MSTLRPLALLAVPAALLAIAPVSSAPQPELTLEWIMRGPEIAGTAPSTVRWSLDGERVYFRWKQPGTPRVKPADWYVTDREGGTPRKLSEEEARESVPPGDGEVTRDRARMVFADDGDLWLLEVGRPGRRALTDTPTDVESAPRWTTDEKHVAFARDGNLYVLTLDGSEPLRQLTDIRRTPPPADPPPATGPARSARDAERELFSPLREQAAAREELLKRQRERAAARRKPFVLTARQTLGSLQLSPDGTQVLASVREGTEGTSRASVLPRFVTESGLVEASPARSGVGEPQGRSRVVLLDVKTGEPRWLAPPAPLKDRPLSMFTWKWSRAGDRLAVLARASDNHDRWIFGVDRATGALRPLHTAHDDAWIGGPGWSDFGWMPDGDRLWLISERSGFSHLVTVPAAGGPMGAEGPETPLTSGPWEVKEAQLSTRGDGWYLTTSEADPGERHLYWMPLEGGARRQITRAPGVDDVTVSPDERTLAVVHTYTNQPAELYVQPLSRVGEPAARRVTFSPTPEFQSYPWRDVPLVDIRARDGASVRARLFTPTGRRNGAGVVFVHGAGYLQNAHRGWSQYEREYMFHHFLADRGYTVVDVDYRGSAGYGRDWRTAIYKNMGGKDLDDAIDAAKWLAATQGVDPKRIGIYGGSYGGFLTLMGMFRAPDVFAAGAALRPVTDWTKYNHPYTANILGLPQEDPEAYRRSSPIHYASGLRGRLLICHGMQDSNVFFQDTVRLTQRLIELGKDFEVAMYPVEDHAFTQTASWIDEYRRIFRLFETSLRGDRR